jgi:hypothetical protein
VWPEQDRTYLFWTIEAKYAQEYMEHCIKIMGGQKQDRKYLFQTPETQYARECTEECIRTKD